MPDDHFTIPEQSTGEAGGPVTFVPPGAPLDPEAPHGRFANGKPRKAPPTPKQSAKQRTAAAPKASTPRTPKAKQATDFRPVVEQAAGVLSMILLGLGAKTQNRAFLADAATVQINAKDGAHVLNEMAKINPVVERLLQVSAPAVPYVMAGNFIFTLGMQFAANHGRALPVQVPGVTLHDPEDLAAGMEAQLAEAARLEQQQADENRMAAAA